MRFKLHTYHGWIQFYAAFMAATQLGDSPQVAIIALGVNHYGL